MVSDRRAAARERHTRYLARQKLGLAVYDLEGHDASTEAMCFDLGFQSDDMNANVSKAWALFLELHTEATRRGKNFADVLISIADDLNNEN